MSLREKPSQSTSSEIKVIPNTDVIKISPLILQNKQVKNCIKVHVALLDGAVVVETLRVAEDKIIAEVWPHREYQLCPLMRIEEQTSFLCI